MERHNRRPSYEAVLWALLLLGWPLVNPLVRGDGFGYFAYLRSAVIDGDWQFENEYRRGNPELLENIAAHGDFGNRHFLTPSGHFPNQYSAGPAVLWAPFFLLAHGGVQIARAAGATVAADGFSAPYRYAVGLGTAFYGSLGVWLCFLVGRRLFSRRAAFWAALAIWLGASLPVYLYFQPSMSHAHSFFLLAWLLYGGLALREGEGPVSPLARLGLGALAGFAVTVYYINAIPVAVLLLGLGTEPRLRRRLCPDAVAGLCLGLGLIAGLAPHLLAKQILYGAFWRTGYEWQPWYFFRPAIGPVLFSSFHGLWSWTPLLLPAAGGWIFLCHQQPRLGWIAVTAFVLFLYAIASFGTWHGISAYGNRFFISLYPFFFLGLGAALQRLGRWGGRAAVAGLLLLMAWNGGFIVQWGTGLVSKRTAIDWGQMARQQVTAVPQMVREKLGGYLWRRSQAVEELQEIDRRHREEQKRQGLGQGYL